MDRISGKKIASSKTEESKKKKGQGKARVPGFLVTIYDMYCMYLEDFELGFWRS